MSHDEPSDALARWLEADPGTEPPAGLDDDVVEAIVALRPEHAPAPRVSADDILALVTEGPLAAPEGGEVVPFPHRAPPPTAEPEQAVDASTPSLPPRWSSLARWGGASGLGLALAAAATLFIVAVPVMQSPEAPSAQSEAPPVVAPRPLPAAADDDEPAPEPEPEPDDLAQASSGVEGLGDAAAQAAPAAAPPPPAQKTAPARPRAAARAPAAEPPPTYPMGGAPVADGNLIPELAELEEAMAEDAVADADAEAPALDLDTLRAAAVPADARPDSWQQGLAAADRERVQALLDAADEAARSGEPGKAGDIAARGIAPPDAAGQAAALAAFDHYRVAGDTTAAIGAAQRGLAYPANTPTWSLLAVRLGDVLRSGDPDAAARWYRDAANANATR